MLKARILTAIALAIPALLIVLYAPLPALALTFAVVSLLCALELGPLFGIQDDRLKIALAAILALAFAIAWRLMAVDGFASGFLIAGFIGWVGIVVWLVFGQLRPAQSALGRISRLIIAMLALVLAWVAIVYIAAKPDGRAALIVLFFLVWGSDIGAFFSGRAFGQRKLAPTISPGKTWEGFYGALAAGALIGLGAWMFGLFSIWWSLWALLVVVASVFGDLAESAAKRIAGVKDSGNLLPGHGGVLDRLDSLLAAAPVFAVGYTLLGA